MSIGSETQSYSLSDSTYLSSSVASLHRPKKSNSEISKTYKHASQLYLTRRLYDSYEALQPVIRPKDIDNKENGHVSQSEDDLKPRAPIASASTSQRIKIWSLYATLLNAIVELDDEEGKQDFGSKLYREIVRNVQSSEVWEQVVKDGYMGREASVDAEVVYNLSNLLLAQAQDQSVNQTRLETYLSSSPYQSTTASIDFSAAFTDTAKSRRTNGMDTPKDLNSRIKILELFTLHVLPRNSEWDYARSFVSNSDVLDEERREAFLQTLNELQEAKEQEAAEAQAAAEQDLVGFADETEEEDYTESNGEKIHTNEDEDGRDGEHILNGDSGPRSPPHRKSFHRRTSSEVDYGIDDDLVKARSPLPPAPQSTAATKATPTSTRTLSPALSAPQPSTTSASSKAAPTNTPTPSTSNSATRKPSMTPSRKPPSKAPPKSQSASGIMKFIRIITNITSNLTKSLTRNPTQVFRTLMFLFAFLAVLGRRDVRERLGRVLAVGWGKLRETAGMGVRVSYV